MGCGNKRASATAVAVTAASVGYIIFNSSAVWGRNIGAGPLATRQTSSQEHKQS